MMWVMFSFLLRWEELSHLMQTFPGGSEGSTGGNPGDFPRPGGSAGMCTWLGWGWPQARAGTKPCAELESNLSQAQDHTGAACSWPGAWQLMSGHALGMDIFPPSLLPVMEKTEGSCQVGLGLSLAFPACLIYKSFWLPSIYRFGTKEKRFKHLTLKFEYFILLFFPSDIYNPGNSGSLLSDTNPTDLF